MVFRPFQRTPRSLPWSEVIRVLRQAGAVPDGQEGSHAQYIRRVGVKSYAITITIHDATEIPPKTLSSIIRQSGLTKRQFWRLYYGGKAKDVLVET